MRLTRRGKVTVAALWVAAAGLIGWNLPTFWW